MWCFATVNNRLVEIFFREEGGKLSINGHCYVEEKEYPTKKEKRWIKSDTSRFQFTYRKKVYTNKVDGRKISLKPFKRK